MQITKLLIHKKQLQSSKHQGFTLWAGIHSTASRFARWLSVHSLIIIRTSFIHFVVPSFLCPVSQSIDPGQQFTWENSNMEVNKPKNRYANVIAYDHSRVVLTSVDGKSSRNHLTPQIAIDWHRHRLRPPSKLPRTCCTPAGAGLKDENFAHISIFFCSVLI